MASAVRVIAVARDDGGAAVSVLLGFEEIEVRFRKENGRLKELSRVFHGKGAGTSHWIPQGLYLRFIRTAWGVFKSDPAPKKDKKEEPMQRTLAFALTLALVFALALAGQALAGQAAPVVAEEPKDMPPCLPQEVMEGKVKMGKHDHAYLLMIGVIPSWDASVAGSGEEDLVGGNVLPAGLGLAKDCVREIHTHAEDGLLHIESVEPGKEHTLAQVLALFGHPEFLTDEKNGRKTVVVADGQIVAEPAKLVLRNNMKILVILPY